MNYIFVLLLVGVVILICVWPRRRSVKRTLPELVLFILFWLLFGEDGPGGIVFAD